MSNSFRQLERLKRDLGDIACQLTHIHFAHFGEGERWRPAINLYRCERSFVVCADLAGVSRTAIEVHATPRRLILRGTRPLPGPACDQPQPTQVLAMEIDYGPYERVLDLPAEIDPEGIAAEHREGFLWIHLPLRASA